jgi:ADP-dependent NAD(P)H-hydrate dehydratase / NAD(P)H-hydrate epimerase
MKILTAAEMREVDRLTIESGISGVILMENAGCRVVDFLCETFAPLAAQNVVVICGKGNNGGDGFVIARQLFTRRLCRQLTVLELFPAEDLAGDALVNRRMLDACGCPVVRELPFEANFATIVVDAILGTGFKGEPHGRALDGIRMIGERFPLAKKVAVDVPSGPLEADYTVTFTAVKSYERTGKLVVANIGTPDRFCETNPIYQLRLTTPDDIRYLFVKRPRDSNKGMYGHVLVIGGSPGKSGAPAMTGLGSYRSGAGLVTVAIPRGAPVPARPELMTEFLDGNVFELLRKMTVLAAGPGLGIEDETIRFVKRLYEQAETPGVFDADALNALAGALPPTQKIRVLTPHPGEMGRLTGKSTRQVQADRLGTAQGLARESGAAIVLKGDHTVIAFPDGETWVNPTGSPALATGGTGDVLTGIIAGLMAQHIKDWRRAVVAAVWLHGCCGELAGEHWGEEAAMATDLLDFLPQAMNEVRPSV